MSPVSFRARSILIGPTNGTLQVGGQTLSGTNGDGFLVKLDAATGLPVSGSAVQTTGIGKQSFTDVTVDSAGTGAVYVTGNLCGVDTVGTDSYSVGRSNDCSKSSSVNDGVVVKFNLDNQFEWSRLIETTGSYYEKEVAQQIVAKNGQIYVTAMSVYDLKFGTMARAAGAYVTKMNASGSFLWATCVGDFTTAAVTSERLAIDSAGNVFLTAS